MVCSLIAQVHVVLAWHYYYFKTPISVNQGTR